MSPDPSPWTFKRKSIFLILEHTTDAPHFKYKLFLTLDHASGGILIQVKETSDERSDGPFHIETQQLDNPAKNISPGEDLNSKHPDQPWVVALHIGETDPTVLERAKMAAAGKRKEDFHHPCVERLSEDPALRSGQITCDWVHEELGKMRHEGCKLYAPIVELISKARWLITDDAVFNPRPRVCNDASWFSSGLFVRKADELTVDFDDFIPQGSCTSNATWSESGSTLNAESQHCLDEEEPHFCTPAFGDGICASPMGHSSGFSKPLLEREPRLPRPISQENGIYPCASPDAYAAKSSEPPLVPSPSSTKAPDVNVSRVVSRELPEKPVSRPRRYQESGTPRSSRTRSTSTQPKHNKNRHESQGHADDKRAEGKLSHHHDRDKHGSRVNSRIQRTPSKSHRHSEDCELVSRDSQQDHLGSRHAPQSRPPAAKYEKDISQGSKNRYPPSASKNAQSGGRPTPGPMTRRDSHRERPASRSGDHPKLPKDRSGSRKTYDKSTPNDSGLVVANDPQSRGLATTKNTLKDTAKGTAKEASKKATKKTETEEKKMEKKTDKKKEKKPGKKPEETRSFFSLFLS